MSDQRQQGFTLTELLLAMAIFSMVLVIITTVFIAINRTYARGIVRKELSEAAQTLAEDVTRTVRSSGGNIASPPDTCSSVPAGFNQSVIIGSASYVWESDDDTTSVGISRGTNDCTSLKALINTRFDVREFNIEKLHGPDGIDLNLYRIYGVITSGDDVFVSMNKDSHPTLYDNPEVRCKGTSQLASTHNCAVEKFNFVINGRPQ